MSFIEDIRIHKAVVWVSNASGRMGQRTYQPAFEIDCRWDQVTSLYHSPAGHDLVAKATIYVDRPLAVDSLIARGTLSDMVSLVDPIANGADVIVFYESLDTLDGDETLHTVKI